MSHRVVAPFNVTGWEEKPYDDPAGGPRLSRTTVTKKFTGELDAESSAELLMCQASAADIKAGAGYVANERVTGKLGDLSGTFVMQHCGLISGGEQRTFGNVVPGSGTGDLKGLTGQVEIEVDDQGRHALILTYELAE